MDACRTINKLEAEEVTVIYRRRKEHMPAEIEEIEDAQKEGVKFSFETDIVQIKEDKIVCIKTELVKDEKSKREVPVNVNGTEFEKNIDYVVIAIGSKLDKEVIQNMGILLSETEYIKVDENYMTNIEGVFAAGDCIGTEATVAWASRSGREAAKKIDEYLEMK